MLRHIILLELVFITLYSSAAFGWNYNEHVSITKMALDRACTKVNEGKLDDLPTVDEAKRLCSAFARTCLSHMVALAGDYLIDLDSLSKEYKGTRYLYKKHVLDCRQFSTSRKLDTSLPSKSVDGIELHSGLMAAITQLKLAASNDLHFQPDAIASGVKQSWKQLSQTLANEKPLSPADAIARFALSSHYLEDAHAAGHNGVLRGRHHQDFDNAYHDDMNQLGLLLENSNGEQWYTFGDEHLDDPIFVVEFANLNHLDARSVIEEVSKQLEIKVELTRGFDASSGSNCEAVKNKIPSLQQLGKCIEANNGQGILLLSLPYSVVPGHALPSTKSIARGIVETLCRATECSDKAEIIVAGAAAPAGNAAQIGCKQGDEKDDDKLVSTELDGVKIHRCWPGRRKVRQHEEAYAEIFLRSLAGERPEVVRQLLSELEKDLPGRYFAWRSRLAGDSTLNDSPVLLKIDSTSSGYAKKELWQPGYGFASLQYDHKHSDNPILDKSALSLSVGSYCVNKLCPDVAKTWRSELRIELLDENENFLDGGEFSFTTPSLRAECIIWKAWCPGYFRNVFGGAFRIMLGTDNFWRGGDRNAYWGLGLELDLHVGRIVIFTDVDKLWHWSIPGSERESLRILVGARIGWLELGTRH